MQKSFREICLQSVDAPKSAGKCLIIGEVAQAHDGSLGAAHAFIDAIASAGADAVKFQTHIAAAESTPNEPWRVKFSKQDATRFDYWKRMEFTPAQWLGLKQHADERNLLFLSTPFSNEAVDLLEKIGVQAWKVASGEINNLPALKKMAETRKPIILSSGMSVWSELDKAVDLIKEFGNPLAILQCTTAYPCPPEKIGLNVLAELKERYENCSVGLSDHSGTIYAGLAAAALGAEILEIHITFSREMFGPDVPASVTTAELKQLVEGIRFIERAQESPVNKDLLAAEMNPLRGMFTKSVVAAFDIPAGTILQPEHFALKKPGTGLSADFIPALTNQRLKRPLQTDEFLRLEDVEPQ
jgi:N,N'-diacetyllegionaminate synthase